MHQGVRFGKVGYLNLVAHSVKVGGNCLVELGYLFFGHFLAEAADLSMLEMHSLRVGSVSAGFIFLDDFPDLRTLRI